MTKKETKFIDLAQFKASNEGPGGFEGYLSRFGELDDGGDIVPAGAYKDTIEQFLTRGFNTESHDWTFSKMIGFPVSAKEDNVGLYVKSQFHSTPDAQLVRVKAQERMDAGKGVYMSIGYEPSAQPIFINAKDYASEIPRYCAPDQVEANMAKASRFSKVRVLPKVELYEGALVTTPMLRSANVTSVKTTSPTEAKDKEQATALSIKGAFEAAIAEQEGSLDYLCAILQNVLRDIDMAEDLAEDMGQVYDTEGAAREALTEFSNRVLMSVVADDDVRLFGEDVDALSEDQDEEEDQDEIMQRAYAGLPQNRTSQKRSLVDGLSFGGSLRAVADAAMRITERAEKRYQMRVKEGRMFSSANISELDDVRTQLDQLTGRIAKLLEAASTQKPKETGTGTGKEADKEKEKEKSADIAAEINQLMIAFQAREAKQNGVQLT